MPCSRASGGDAEKGDVVGAREGQRRMDLVAQHPGAVLGAPAASVPSCPAVGTEPVGLCGLQRISATAPPRNSASIPSTSSCLDQGHFGELQPELLDHREEGVVHGRVDDDPVAGLRDVAQQRGDRVDHVRRGGDAVRVDLPVEPRRGEPRERLGSPSASG